MTKARDLANASTALSAVSATELGYLDGVTSAVQTQMDAKLASSTAATTYVANALADAKGDLLTASADNTPARLAVGNNGETLVADSSTSTGLRYNPTQAAGKNAIINGGMDIWQRGTSFAYSGSSYVYSADRWEHVRDSYTTGATVSRQSSGLQGFRYCMRVQRDSGNTSIAAIYAEQSIETSQALPYCNTTVTVSFYARAGANYSASGNILTAKLLSGTGTDQALKNYTGAVVVGFNDVVLTTSWQRFSFTATSGATANELGVNFRFGPTGTAGTNDYFEVTGVQLELGSVPTAFTKAGGTIQGELAACQRYYQVIGGVAVSYPLMGGYSVSGSEIRFPTPFPVQMRTAPTITKNGTWEAVNTGQPSAVYISSQGFCYQTVTTVTGTFYIHPNSSDDSFTISAEL